MTSNVDLYEMMARCVEAIEDVEGVRVDDANIAERMEGGGGNPLAAMMGMGGEPATQQVLAIVAEPPEEPHVPYPDDPSEEDFRDIEIEEPQT